MRKVENMNILVIGNGGREDALCKALSQSSQCEQLFCSDGNAGTLRYGQNVSLPTHEDVLNFSKTNGIDLVVVGPEQPLCDGLVDLLQENGIACFGANKTSAQLEASKDFAKQFMQKYNLPTARYETVTSYAQGLDVIQTFTYPLVIKADGLCAGKGVKICQTKEDAQTYLHDLFEQHIFGDQGNRAVIEEFLTGTEASLLCLVSNNRILPLESAKDYKRIFEDDKGDNTGGVGCYSPSELFNDTLQQNVAVLLKRIEEGLQQEHLTYCGILFIGFMIENNTPKILEFNVRFGDPETEVVLPRLQSDFVTIIEKTLNGTIQQSDLVWRNEKAMTVVLTSKGYPGHYETGKVITGLTNNPTLQQDVFVYHNNTKQVDDVVYTNGGRVLSITTLGTDFEQMRSTIYHAIDTIHFEGKQYRRDIAHFKG